MASTATKTKTSAEQELEDMVNSMTANKSRATTQQKEDAKATSDEFANIEANPFYNACFDPELGPDEKQKAFAAVITAAETKEAQRQTAKELAVMLEYLQSVKQELAKDSIRLSDPKNFGVVRDVLMSMGGDMKDLFENKLKPLTDILDVFEKLDVGGNALNIYSEIEDQKNADAKKAADAAALTAAYEAKKQEAERIKAQIAAEATHKNLFGQIKAGSVANIAMLQTQLEQTLEQRDLAAKATEDFEVSNRVDPNSTDELAEAKRMLANFLDTTSEQHEKFGKDLIETALKAIETSKEKTGLIKKHQANMESQIEAQDDTATTLAMTYGIIQGGLDIAQENNLSKRKQFDTAADGETAIATLSRVSKQSEMNDYIDSLNSIKTNVNATVLDLSTDAINIKNMKATNRNSMQLVDEMNSRGVATVASSIATTVSALGSQALTESSNIAANILADAQGKSDLIAKKQLLKTAGAIDERNMKLQETVANLQAFNTLKNKASEISRAGLERLADTNKQMESLAKAVASSLAKDASQSADVLSGTKNETTETTSSKPAVSKPFGKM